MVEFSTMSSFYEQLARDNPRLPRKHAKFPAFFKGCDPVVELGPAQGYFLDLMRTHHITAFGVDNDAPSVKQCSQQGLTVHKQDALTFLKKRKAASLGGFFTSNLIEHLEPKELSTLLDLACQRLRVGGRMALVTANPKNLGVHADAFYAALDHRRFYPLELLSALLSERGMDILIAAEDEASREPGPLRWLVRKIRSLLIGPYFGPPEIYITAVKTNRRTKPGSSHLTCRR